MLFHIGKLDLNVTSKLALTLYYCSIGHFTYQDIHHTNLRVPLLSVLHQLIKYFQRELIFFLKKQIKVSIVFILFVFILQVLPLYFSKAESQWIALYWICIAEITSGCLSTRFTAHKRSIIEWNGFSSKIDLFWVFFILQLNNV